MWLISHIFLSFNALQSPCWEQSWFKAAQQTNVTCCDFVLFRSCSLTGTAGLWPPDGGEASPQAVQNCSQCNKFTAEPQPPPWLLLSWPDRYRWNFPLLMCRIASVMQAGHNCAGAVVLHKCGSHLDKSTALKPLSLRVQFQLEACTLQNCALSWFRGT